jgi:hypothetical protein
LTASGRINHKAGQYQFFRYWLVINLVAGFELRGGRVQDSLCAQSKSGELAMRNSIVVVATLAIFVAAVTVDYAAANGPRGGYHVKGSYTPSSHRR